MYIYEKIISEAKYNTVSITKGRSLLHRLVLVALFFAFCFSNISSFVFCEEIRAFRITVCLIFTGMTIMKLLLFTKTTTKPLIKHIAFVYHFRSSDDTF